MNRKRADSTPRVEARDEERRVARKGQGERADDGDEQQVGCGGEGLPRVAPKVAEVCHGVKIGGGVARGQAGQTRDIDKLSRRPYPCVE